jgi:hypothetical protein
MKRRKETPLSRADIGMIPWRFLNTLANASGDRYPYFMAKLITLVSVVCNSKAANVNLRRRMYSDNEIPVMNGNPTNPMYSNIELYCQYVD